MQCREPDLTHPQPRRDDDRAAGLAALRWVLGGSPVDLATFRRGFRALPPHLRPLVASHAIGRLDGLDENERERLKAIERAAAVAWMSRRAAVRIMQSALDAAGIPVVFLKGIALAEQVYPSPATRTMSDIDAWVRAEDLPRAVGALTEAGLVLPPRHQELASLRGPSPVAYLEATMAGGVVFVEVHTRPGSLRELAEPELASLRSTAVTAGPTALPVLRLDGQLLHVCLHATRSHGCIAGLKSLVDVGMVVRAWPPGDLWNAFVDAVERVGAITPVYVCLALARERLGIAVPEDVLDRLRVPEADAMLSSAEDLMWSPSSILPRGTDRLFAGSRGEEWLRNRLVLRPGLTAAERERMAPSERPGAREVLRYFWNRIAALLGAIVRGELFRPDFWKRVRVQRRARAWTQALERLERRPDAT